jgi:hypothetical protein
MLVLAFSRVTYQATGLATEARTILTVAIRIAVRCWKGFIASGRLLASLLDGSETSAEAYVRSSLK